MVFNYRKLLEKTKFDLVDLFCALTHTSALSSPSDPPMAEGPTVPSVLVGGTKSYVLSVEHRCNPLDRREGTITIRYLEVKPW